MIQGPSFHCCQAFVFHKILKEMKGIPSLSKNIPNGLFPSAGAKLIILSAFSAMLDSCINVSLTPDGRSSTSHQSSLLSNSY